MINVLEKKMKKILIVDDWINRLKSTRERLNKKGYRVEQVTNAKQAWEKVNTSRYDIIIIDTSEDVEVRRGSCLSDILQEDYPNTLRIGWTAAAWYLSPQDKEKYHITLSKPVRIKDIKKGIEEGYRRMND
jgi:DNA-binding NtrC family response regulator